jgi:hypothetical protein
VKKKRMIRGVVTHCNASRPLSSACNTPHNHDSLCEPRSPSHWRDRQRRAMNPRRWPQIRAWVAGQQHGGRRRWESERAPRPPPPDVSASSQSPRPRVRAHGGGCAALSLRATQRPQAPSSKFAVTNNERRPRRREDSALRLLPLLSRPPSLLAPARLLCPCWPAAGCEKPTDQPTRHRQDTTHHTDVTEREEEVKARCCWFVVAVCWT